MKKFQIFLGLTVLVLALSVTMADEQRMITDGKVIGGVCDGSDCHNTNTPYCAQTGTTSCGTRVTRCLAGSGDTRSDLSGAGSNPCGNDSACRDTRM